MKRGEHVRALMPATDESTMPRPRAGRARALGLAALVFSPIAALMTAACAPTGTGPNNALPSTGSRSTGEAWAQVAPPSTGVRLELPKPPTLETEQGRMPDGGRLTTTHGVSASTTPTIVYQFFVTEFEAGLEGNPAAVLDEMIDEYIDSSEGAEIRSSGPVDMRGFPGTELVLYRYDEDILLRARQWVGKSRAYLFIAATPSREESNSARAIDRFFNSIVLDAADAPGPAGDGVLNLEAWQTIYPPTDSFVVQIPGAPNGVPLNLTLAEKDAEGHAYRVSRADGRVRFAVEALEFDDRPPAAAIDELVSRMTSRGLTVRDVRDTHRQGYPARAVSLASASDVIYVVFIETQTRLYAVSLTVPAAEEASFVAHRQRFFRSLRIL